jgi:hypothetical protein
VTRKERTPANIDGLVDRMFDQVLSEAERAELLDRIREWEAANPDVAPAQRVTAWIDLAYELQASHRDVRPSASSHANTHTSDFEGSPAASAVHP